MLGRKPNRDKSSRARTCRRGQSAWFPDPGPQAGALHPVTWRISETTHLRGPDRRRSGGLRPCRHGTGTGTAVRGEPERVGATSRPDNRPGPKTAEQAKKRAKALALLAERQGDTEEAAGWRRDGRTLGRPGRRGRVPARQGRTPSSRSSRSSVTPGPASWAPPPARCTTRSRSRRRTTTPRTGSSDFDKAHYEEMFNGAGPVVQGLLPQAVRRPVHGHEHRDRLGQGARQRVHLR